MLFETTQEGPNLWPFRLHTVPLASEDSRNAIRCNSATDQVLRWLHHRIRMSAVLGQVAIVFAADLPLMPYLCRRVVFADTPLVVEK